MNVVLTLKRKAAKVKSRNLMMETAFIFQTSTNKLMMRRNNAKRSSRKRRNRRKHKTKRRTRKMAKRTQMVKMLIDQSHQLVEYD